VLEEWLKEVRESWDGEAIQLTFWNIKKDGQPRLSAFKFCPAG